jgi:hypothetical protein
MSLIYSVLLGLSAALLIYMICKSFLNFKSMANGHGIERSRVSDFMEMLKGSVFGSLAVCINLAPLVVIKSSWNHLGFGRFEFRDKIVAFALAATGWYIAFVLHYWKKRKKRLG